MCQVQHTHANWTRTHTHKHTSMRVHELDHPAPPRFRPAARPHGGDSQRIMWHLQFPNDKNGDTRTLTHTDTHTKGGFVTPGSLAEPPLSRPSCFLWWQWRSAELTVACVTFSADFWVCQWEGAAAVQQGSFETTVSPPGIDHIHMSSKSQCSCGDLTVCLREVWYADPGTPLSYRMCCGRASNCAVFLKAVWC